MRADIKALLKVFGWSFALTLVVFGGLGVAGTVGWLTKEMAASLMAACLVVDATVIGLKFKQALFSQPPRQHKATKLLDQSESPDSE